MACIGTSVADVSASRVGLLVVVVSTDVDADFVAGAVVVAEVDVSGISACLMSVSCSLPFSKRSLHVSECDPCQASHRGTGTVTVDHASSDVLAPDHKLKSHYRWLLALKSSDHPSDLFTAPVSTWSMSADSSSSMSSSFIADEVLFCELADADIDAFLPSREQLECPTELVEQSPRRVRSRPSRADAGEGTKGRIANILVECFGGFNMFAIYFLADRGIDSEEWAAAGGSNERSSSDQNTVNDCV